MWYCFKPGSLTFSALALAPHLLRIPTAGSLLSFQNKTTCADPRFSLLKIRQNKTNLSIQAHLFPEVHCGLLWKRRGRWVFAPRAKGSTSAQPNYSIFEPPITSPMGPISQ